LFGFLVYSYVYFEDVQQHCRHMNSVSSAVAASVAAFPIL